MNIAEHILEKRRNNDLTSTLQETQSGELLVRAMERILEQKDFFDPNAGTVGVEAEYVLVNGDLSPVSEEVRNSVIKSANNISQEGQNLWSFQHEMGAAQIEANQSMDAILPKGFSPYELLNLFRVLDDDLTQAANENNSKVLKLGLHPTEKLAETKRTNYEKYQMVPAHHNINRLESSKVLSEEMGIRTEPDGSAVGLSQALQFNIAAESPKQAIEMSNWLMQSTPAILAITGNAPMAEGVATGWQEPRNRIWDQTHLTSNGSRVFLPDGGFFRNVEDVFNHMGRFPLIIKPSNEFEALAIATGTKWLASKLKFLADPESLNLNKILVEFRPLSIQQTPEANAAATLLSLGRLFWAKNNNEPLMNFKDVKENGMTSMREGMGGMYKVTIPLENGNWEVREVNGKEMKRIELEKAIHGLVQEGHGTEQEIRGFFENCLPENSPADELMSKIEEQGGIKNREIMKNVLIKVLSENRILS